MADGSLEVGRWRNRAEHLEAENAELVSMASNAIARTMRVEALVSEIERKLFAAHAARLDNVAIEDIRAAINQYREEERT